jgi:hypothetical protein
MVLQLGTAEVNRITLGNIDVVGNPSTNYRTITVAENILNPLGQRANIKIVDKYDALGSSNFRGESQLPVDIGFTEYLSRARAGFDLRVFEGADLNDGSEELAGNGRIKVYDIKCVSPEYLKNLDNQLEHSYRDYTTNIVKDILTEHLETDKSVEIQEDSSTLRNFRFTRSPMEALKALNEEHVGTSSRSSAFIVFQQQKRGNSKYIITTFEQLFRQSPVVTLYKSGRINFSSATRDEIVNSIIRMNVDTAFFSPNRFLTGAYDRSYNMSTGTIGDYTTQRSDPNNNVERRGRRIIPTVYDALNDPQEITTAEARTLRAYFVAQLSENYAEFTIHGNPNISLGDVVNLNIPTISAAGGSREEMFSGKALVVSLLHNIVEPGYAPQYTMTLGCVRIT